MPSKLEKHQRMMQKLEKIIFGDPAEVENMRWYNWIFLTLKIVGLCLGFYFLLTKEYLYAAIFLIASAIDIFMAFQMNKRYKAYKEYQILRKQAKIPKGKHEQ